MSGRSYHKEWTQGVVHVNYNLEILPMGSTGTVGPTGPLVNEGDSGSVPGQTGTATGSYVSVFRGASAVAATGITGSYYVRTADPFPAIVDVLAHVAVSTGLWNVQLGVPVQNADNTWSIPFWTFLGNIATDVPGGPGGVGNRIYLKLVFRNSITKP